jgi:hypothetical protein
MKQLLILLMLTSLSLAACGGTPTSDEGATGERRLIVGKEQMW